GAEGKDDRLAIQTMNTFRASVGAAACGMARRALDEAIAYAGRRQQFGVPLVAHQLIQAKLADMVTALDAARLLVYRAAHLHDTGVAAEAAARPRASRAPRAKPNSSPPKPPHASLTKPSRFT